MTLVGRVNDTYIWLYDLLLYHKKNSIIFENI